MEAELAEAQAAENGAAAVGPTADPMVKDEVGPDDVAEVVAAWTGIPAGRLLEGETEKLLRMEEIIGGRLIGQSTAVRAVSDAVRRARAGVSDPDRPTGSFLFLGPTGVGKTELAKSLADFLFDDERAMVRIDMSEYSERHSVSRLVGAPPGYVGYEEGGQLTEAVRRRPYTVVLLDEVEKAHPEVFDILLQVLDDGRLTDGQGRTVDFRNAILVLTSNLGSQFLVDPMLDEATKREAVMAAVRAAFKPEFLNRLDDVVIFDPLGTAELARIVDLQVDLLARRLADRRLTLEVTDAAREWLALTGYDPAYGARPLRRLVQTQIGDRLARAILAGEVHDGDTVRIDLDAAKDALTLARLPERLGGPARCGRGARRVAAPAACRVVTRHVSHHRPRGRARDRRAADRPSAGRHPAALRQLRRHGLGRPAAGTGHGGHARRRLSGAGAARPGRRPWCSAPAASLCAVAPGGAARRDAAPRPQLVRAWTVLASGAVVFAVTWWLPRRPSRASPTPSPGSCCWPASARCSVSSPSARGAAVRARAAPTPTSWPGSPICRPASGSRHSSCCRSPRSVPPCSSPHTWSVEHAVPLAPYRSDMQRLSIGILGLIAVAVGLVWTLQGTDVLGGSGMSGHHIWAVIGIVLILAGVACVSLAARRRRHL